MLCARARFGLAVCLWASAVCAEPGDYLPAFGNPFHGDYLFEHQQAHASIEDDIPRPYNPRPYNPRPYNPIESSLYKQTAPRREMWSQHPMDPIVTHETTIYSSWYQLPSTSKNLQPPTASFNPNQVAPLPGRIPLHQSVPQSNYHTASGSEVRAPMSPASLAESSVDRTPLCHHPVGYTKLHRPAGRPPYDLIPVTGGSNGRHTTPNNNTSKPHLSTRPSLQPTPSSGQRLNMRPSQQPVTSLPTGGSSGSSAACQRYRNYSQRLLANQMKLGGGRSAFKEEFPYMVAIGYLDGDKIIWLCGGSLISENFVLTAAHCITQDQQREVLMLRAGVKRLAAARRAGDLGVAAVVPHPRSGTASLYYDVALLLTDRPVATSPAVRPVCMPPPAQSPFPGAVWAAAGWGANSSDDEHAFEGDLRQASFIELAEKDCEIEGTSIVPNGLSNLILCARHRQNHVCKGDSGGPLVMQGKDGQDIIVGVSSRSGNPCSGGKLALFVRVAPILPWIERTVWPK